MDKRVSSAGAEFIRDNSVSALGDNAFRDPSGLVWGDLVKGDDGLPKGMNQKSANKYCQKIGTRLPSKEDFEQLEMFLGVGYGGYNPYTADGKLEVLPEIDFIPGYSWPNGHTHFDLWTSDAHKLPLHGYVYSNYGHVGYDLRMSHNFVRCVFK